MSSTIAAIIVAHNSADVLPNCLQSLERQEGCNVEIFVVDSGSRNTDYLKELQKYHTFQLIIEGNVGFSKANNRGFEAISANIAHVVFLNPDTFLPPDYLLSAESIMQGSDEVAVVSGILARYDMETGKPLKEIDSTGIFRNWYGRWYDRDQGKDLSEVVRERDYLPAVCGALMFCRRSALAGLAGKVFDPDFFLYKEDIELSLRLRKRGWKLLFDPQLRAYHCRGWQKKRTDISYSLRLTAAKSEVLLYRKHFSIYICWALLKYLLVRLARA